MLLYLQSKAIDKDEYFYDSLLCLAEQNENGALGFVINRPFARTLNELQEFSFLPPFPLYEGGPVDSKHLYFIHRRPDLIEDGKAISEGIYLGGNFKHVVNAIAKKTLQPNDIRIFIGYCGWDAGDLENEMKQDAWQITEADLFFGIL